MVHRRPFLPPCMCDQLCRSLLWSKWKYIMLFLWTIPCSYLAEHFRTSRGSPRYAQGKNWIMHSIPPRISSCLGKNQMKSQTIATLTWMSCCSVCKKVTTSWSRRMSVPKSTHRQSIEKVLLSCHIQVSGEAHPWLRWRKAAERVVLPQTPMMRGWIHLQCHLRSNREETMESKPRWIHTIQRFPNPTSLQRTSIGKPRRLNQTLSWCEVWAWRLLALWSFLSFPQTCTKNCHAHADPSGMHFGGGWSAWNEWRNTSC